MKNLEMRLLKGRKELQRALFKVSLFTLHVISLRSVKKRQKSVFTKLGTEHGNSTLLELNRVLQELVCINGQNIPYFRPLKLGAHLGSLTSGKTFPATWLLLYRKRSVLITATLDFTNWFHSSLLCPLPSSSPIS